MDNWDEEKLRSVIMSKHGNLKTTTDKVCKYFIEAVENAKYGWFWVCPNGGNECMYRHSLPPGFVLKTKEQKKLERLAAESAPKITLEDFIELERGKLDRSKFIPITLDSFQVWKAKKRDQQAREERKEREKRKRTGREIVMDLFADKYYSEEDNKDEWDLSEFRESLPEVESDVKDYGNAAEEHDDIDNDEETDTNGTLINGDVNDTTKYNNNGNTQKIVESKVEVEA
ncbi:hypothetical protein CANTEDRAFT_114355 [Yamadazyma tenuis ATCC 10573]|nr:uncharacterized protein CANTEDRAFT_114355 [Yamadazyma tenuis ATCC 10573]EGV63528.1 hypothetical protein CANTEDRAFT_114355 [Yamadazyma tenuis ATCC 10573]